MFAKSYGATTLGVDGLIIDVEVDAGFGFPAFDIVGLPDTAVRESKERVRTAINNSGIKLKQEKVTINLAPADIRKDSSGLDLPIAVGLLAAHAVLPVETLAGTKVDQVCIGSCTNSSLFDMLKVAALLKGRTIAPGVSLSISPGSKQVLTMLSDCGALTDILASGARLLECACGPCIGMGFSPNSGGVSLRTFNRNFLGRSGTKDRSLPLFHRLYSEFRGVRAPSSCRAHAHGWSSKVVTM